ncbi:hypothetical protein [Parafrankia sp. BMG5.11]|uniref:hypothetical protein n=1 Tax=Parafrankia sp. BMG5.11 TaxID=222540 RepID=UPI001405228D|nr:hypothetical protein [Parafrankia sp. BMG5.11]CAI7975258.1 hypothetical protein FRAHR75_170025 [Frankia sp. Hr75.2]
MIVMLLIGVGRIAFGVSWVEALVHAVIFLGGSAGFPLGARLRQRITRRAPSRR